MRMVIVDGRTVRERTEFMRTHQEEFPVAAMSQLLGVSRSGFCSVDRRGTGPRAVENAELAQEIHRIHQESRGHYGSPRVHIALGQNGRQCGVNRVARIMKELGLQGMR